MSVKVKALAWKSNGAHDANSLWTGEIACGVFYTIEPDGRVFRLERGQFLSAYPSDDMGLFPTVAAAQAEAQKDWHLRITPALEPTKTYEDGLRALLIDLKKWNTFQFGGNQDHRNGVEEMRAKMIERIEALALSGLFRSDEDA